MIAREHDPIRVLDRGTTSSLNSRLLNETTNAPWSNDGLDDEERVRIISSLGDYSFGPYVVQSETIDLPMAGEVTVWLALRDPSPGYEDLLRFTPSTTGTNGVIGPKRTTTARTLAKRH